MFIKISNRFHAMKTIVYNVRTRILLRRIVNANQYILLTQTKHRILSISISNLMIYNSYTTNRYVFV